MMRNLFLILSIVAFASCNNTPKPDPELQSLYDETMKTGRIIRDEIRHKLIVLEPKIEMMRADGDSMMTRKLSFTKQYILDTKEAVLALERKADQIPGVAHIHDHDDPDHVCSHGKSPLEGLPLNEQLELMKELHTELMRLKGIHDNTHVD
jgi:hypothetical protein